MVKTNTGLVNYSRLQVGLPYWYGTFGQRATMELYNSKKKQYPSYYKDNDFKNQIGKRVHDCVGLIKGYIWSDTPTSTPKYNAEQDKSAAGMYAASSLKGTISNFPKKAGQLVYKGATAAKITHVGIYDGNGYVYEAKGHRYGVVKTVFKASEWPYWSQCPYIADDSGTASTGNTTNTNTNTPNTSTSKPTYKVGEIYTTQVKSLTVRTGAGTSYAKKAKSQLTADGQKNSNSAGQLNSGVRCTCKAVKNVGNDVWIQIPSGWVAAYYSGKYYVK